MARSKSDSGAYMSQYDTEVEKRLQALEKAVAECKASCESHSHGGAADAEALHQVKNEIFEASKKITAATDLEDKVNRLVNEIKDKINDSIDV